MINDEILEKNCNTECPRYAAGTCPFLPSEKKECLRIKDYARAISDLALCGHPQLTAQEFLDDTRLAGVVWKHIVRFRFDDISYEAFINAIQIAGGLKNNG